MSHSLFKNFDPDKLKIHLYEVGSLELGPNIWLVMIHLLDVCAGFHTYEHADGLFTLSNDEFHQLWARVKVLADAGLSGAASPEWSIGLENDSGESEEVAVVRRALSEDLLRPIGTPARSQIYALAGLFLIDQTMTRAAQGGLTVEVVDMLAKASINLAEARSCEYSQPEFKRFARAINLLDIEHEFRRRESAAAVVRAGIRHEFSNSAKEFVKQEWAAKKAAYGSNKTEFARSYVPIVANRFVDRHGDPLKITEKQLREVWLSDTPPACKPARQRAGG